jgi:type VI secretion system protein ImpL
MRRFFQTLFKPFKKAWVWYLILLLVLSALVWFVGPLVRLTSPGWRLFIILLLVVAWALNALRLQRKKLREELTAKEHNNLPTLVDANLLEKSIADLQGKYKKALQTVAKRNPWTLFLTFKRDQLPWYLVLGSQGSGKTSLLTDSGLHFPLGNDALIDMKEKPEVLVQWRFAKDAVFIDTDGALTTFTNNESLASKVWQELLELMAWHKVRKSLNGIILTISMQELLAQTTEQRRQLAHAIRSRISEIEEEIGVKYPIYVQITKTDVLAGFKEFFEQFTEQERNQIWGMTFPDRDEDVIHLFPAEFDKLVARLNDYLLPILQTQREPSKASLVTMFASQFASSKSPLIGFLNQIFETNHYQEKGYLRGIFFTSCRQDTKPINRMLLAEAKTLGLQQGSLQVEERHNQTYFIHNIFRDVILQETHLLQMSTDQSRKMNLHRKSAYVVIGVLILAMGYVWLNSYLLNKTKLDDLSVKAQDYLQNFYAYYSGKSEIPPSLSELYLMRHMFKPETDPTSMHWGLYQGERFTNQINTIYLQQLRRQFVPLLQQTIEDQLKKNIRNPSQSYNFLRVYLMLADPTQMNKQFVESWMQQYWQQTLPDQTVFQATLNENLDEYLDLDKLGISLDKQLVADVRAILRRTSPAERVYFELEKEAAGRNVSISNQFDSDFSQIFGQASLDQKISYLYTKSGYENIYKKDLKTLVDDVADSNWILGNKDKQQFNEDELASIKRYVQVRYMQNYTDAWLKLLGNFKIEKFDSLSNAANVLTMLSQPTSPLKQILDEVYKNTTLEKDDASPAAMATRKSSGGLANLAPKSASAAKSLLSAKGLARTAMRAGRSGAITGGADQKTTAVGAAFFDLNTIVRSSREQPKPGAKGKEGNDKGGSPYGGIQTAFSNLSAYVQNIANAADPNRAAFEAAQARLTGKGDDAISKLIQLANSSPEPLKEWMNAIASNTWAIILAQAKVYINQAWQENVWPAYEQTLLYHYPLSKSSNNDATMNDFTIFFAPGGIYDTFFQQYLAPFVNTASVRWSMVQQDGSALPLSRINIQQLQLVHYIQQAFFSSGKIVSVPFSVKPTDLSQSAGSATLNVAGQNINYAHGPIQSTDVVWPAASPTQMASISVYTIAGAQQSINTSGDWAWLKLLDRGRIKRSYSASTINVSFNINGRVVAYSLEVKGKFNAFDVSVIHSVRLPRTL